jgi:hypothetical protein
MKKLLTTIALMAAALTVQAQEHEEGDFTIQPRVGISLSNLTGDGEKWKTNVAYGVEFERFFSERFSLAAGVLFTNQGTKYKDIYDGETNQKDDMKMNIYYANVPITANYYLLPGLAVKAGLQPAFRVKAQARMGSTSYDYDRMMDLWKSWFDGETEEMTKFDLSIPVGLSYEIARVTIDARYNIGLLKVIKGESVRNKAFVFTIGYKFGN